MNKPFPFNARRGFSLIEILTVISIISALAVVVTPALSSLSGAGGTTRAVSEVSGTIEHARQTAMQMGTWVWVGLADTTALNNTGPQLSIVEVASRDGSTDLSAGNLIALKRPTHVEQVQSLQTSDPAALVLGSATGEFALKWTIPTAQGQTEVDFSKMVIGFSPRGEAVLGTKDVPAWIKISLAGSRNAKDAISLLVSGPSGQLVVVR